MAMTAERWEFLERYAAEVFGGQDEQLDQLMSRADTAGLPAISISPDVGRLLKILVSMTDGKLAIELGTLGGYSGIWIARGLADEGKLITVEYNDEHADFAQAEFEKAGVADKVEIVRGAALEVLPDLVTRFGEASVDFVFIDAIKSEYVAYLELLEPMVKSGGVVVGDDAYGTRAGWIDEGYGTDEFNRFIASHPDFDAVGIPISDGVVVARKVS